MRAINILGSKVANAHLYPPPSFSRIIEPFAGGAGYALRHWRREVWLCDVRRSVTEAWQYLIDTPPDEVLQLPLLLPGQHVSELGVCPGAARLIAWCADQSMAPKGRLSRWADGESVAFWSRRRRAMAADVAERVKHWLVHRGPYTDLINVEATWFVDPPYAFAPKAYDTRPLNYPALAEWCRGRAGQVIVCERAGADWLPFVPAYSVARTGKVHGGPTHSDEVVWHRQ